MVLLSRGRANGKHMHHSTTQYYSNKICYLLKYLLASILVSLLSNTAYAASQGKLGIQSSASVDISVTVNQSLSAVSPNELMLNNSNQNGSASMPFCIAHQGFKKKASVPYELVVDSLVSPHKDQQTLPYKIYLEDKNKSKNKLLLNSGTTISKQSTLNISEQVIDECANNGLKLSIEKFTNENKDTSKTAAVGLMILLVSPN